MPRNEAEQRILRELETGRAVYQKALSDLHQTIELCEQATADQLVVVGKALQSAVRRLAHAGAGLPRQGYKW